MVEFGVIGKRAVDGLSIAQDDAVGLRAGEEFGPFPRAEDDEVGGGAGGERGLREGAGAGGVRQEGVGPVVGRMVEVADAGGLAA